MKTSEVWLLLKEKSVEISAPSSHRYTATAGEVTLHQ